MTENADALFEQMVDARQIREESSSLRTIPQGSQESHGGGEANTHSLRSKIRTKKKPAVVPKPAARSAEARMSPGGRGTAHLQENNTLDCLTGPIINALIPSTVSWPCLCQLGDAGQGETKTRGLLTPSQVLVVVAEGANDHHQLPECTAKPACRRSYYAPASLSSTNVLYTGIATFIFWGRGGI